MTTHKNVYIVLLVVFASIFSVEIFSGNKPKHPDACLNITQLVQKYKYPVEIHEVVTEDGYILTLYRIPHGPNRFQKKRTPILFMHGFTQTASDFLYQGPGKALSFLLADQGYDIWLGNARGSTWSRRHERFDPDKDKEFWDFSMHEIGVYDIPALVDHILNVTAQKKLQYVGYSQGTLTYFILMSERPEYNNKVTLMSALAPAIFLKDPHGLVLSTVIYFRKIIETVALNILGVQQLAPHGGLVSRYLKHICDENSVFLKLCINHISLLHGYRTEGINKSLLSLIFSNMPAGASAKQLVHVFQFMDLGKFQNYDFGVKGNLEKYGLEKPPTYNLSRVTSPVALYYSSGDWVINVKNIERLVRSLPNVVKSYQVPMENFNHNDFVYANDADRLLYDSVIEEIVRH